VRGEERFIAIKNFNETECFVFLLSTRSGGQGLNLTSANTVIFFDSDFNPQRDIQAAARAHRIGQTKPVQVIRLVDSNTVEEIILHRAMEKMILNQRVIEEGRFIQAYDDTDLLTSDRTKPINLQEIIKFGLKKVLESDENTNDDDSKITDEDIDSILSKAQIVRETPHLKRLEENSEDIVSSRSMYLYDGIDYSGTIRKLPRDISELESNSFNVFSAVAPSAQDETAFQMFLNNIETQNTELFKEMLPSLRTPPSLEPRKEQIQWRKLQRKLEKKKLLWEKHHYQSKSINNIYSSSVSFGEIDIPRLQSRDNPIEELPSSLKEEEEEERNSLVSSTNSNSETTLESQRLKFLNSNKNREEIDERCIFYVTGNALKPQGPSTCNAIIVNCMDNSGIWGNGAFFSAIGLLYPQVKEEYELAGQMDDLELGSVHLIEGPRRDFIAGENIEKREQRKSNDHLPTSLFSSSSAAAAAAASEVSRIYIANLIVQRRTKKTNKISGILAPVLETALTSLATEAKRLKATVHCPRIGQGTMGFSWYSVERVIRLCLTSNGIDTYIYYFKKQNSLSTSSSSLIDQPLTQQEHGLSSGNLSFSDKNQNRKRDATFLTERESVGRQEIGSFSSEKHKNLIPINKPVEHDHRKALVFNVGSFLKGVHALLFSMSENKKKYISELLTSCGGVVEISFNRSTTTHIITELETSNTIIDALRAHSPDLMVVKVEWILSCCQRKKRLSEQEYLLC